MEIIKVATVEEGSKVAFELIKKSINKGARVFGLATGSTPEHFYQEILASDLDFSDKISINLDEYVGLGEGDEQSYDTFMKEHLFNQKPFAKSYLPDGKAGDLTAEVKHYDQIIDSNPIDFQILGIGQNGHIGFNEPGSSFDLTTHVVDLTPSTIQANSRYFDNIEDVPTQAVSMGIKSVMKSKEIVLMAWGEQKADAIAKMVNGEVTETLPASVLQNHPNVTVIVDADAARLLN
ncbi:MULTISPECIES: glucosamine-6-phosphate deaminase [unclassified Enterococcus]|uniref:glucosamine-6-phosphate deaminase n=1 Tax=unclassified Enterococcus TaxID=2608891 RepID=UPI001555217F|nr:MULTISPECIES: glucosamine-6-phosphate deaminase [unclassified Enterococcus]MBS7576862.1 glucosamine-6-phosphate deaminase [Enterococcus sp. MMGLQ5-2]MBS7584269.1 glucosamine-6-phosphate deaminase [Enterococcus sp. MMGLQ5-1]NPD12125.1 glucosamine-6-phosphate deaminase [Enterococcus sp. MMGLQ5-1]NPD36697.1 glucosamine-6-phosphate deaminase [Enterococcus sp. MMGLQ5-2]